MIAAMHRGPTARLMIVLSLAALFALAGCAKADNEPGPGGVSVGEAKVLDEAAQMLEDRRLPAEAIPAPRERAAAQGVKKPAG